MREKLQHQLKGITLQGITPACAGKTQTLLTAHLLCWDHPRVCGKNILNLDDEAYDKGSPPRVREKLTCTIRKVYLYRITPACAGKTFTKDFFGHFEEDHPRVCGKN